MPKTLAIPFKSNLVFLVLIFSILLSACDYQELNNPYPENEDNKSILYSSFSERPKHLDPAIAYSANEYTFICQIYEPPLQYHYLKRPYTLSPLAATALPEINYLSDKAENLGKSPKDNDIAFTDYIITIQPNIHYQPHPAFAKNAAGNYEYHALNNKQINSVNTLADFKSSGSRELLAEDYIYEIKRLAHPKIGSPIAEMLKKYIVGFAEFSQQMGDKPNSSIRNTPMSGIEVLSPYSYKIRIKGKYPQFAYWLAMPFFAPIPWEADAFYDQPGLKEKNITLDWYPIGTGAYFLSENNPNRRMTLTKNPLFHLETYPTEGEPEDKAKGLLKDAGKPLPFIERAEFMMEKETIPFWTKFLQGYYDASGIASDSFDQAVQFTGVGSVALTDAMKEKDIQLETSVETSLSYLGFNMLDATVGGISEKARNLRLAISMAIDYEEYISIFRNGRGLVAQGLLPPGIFGFAMGKEGINPYSYDWVEGKEQRKSIAEAKRLMTKAGYENGIDPNTKESLILYFDTPAAGIDARALMNWYREQLKKLGINLVIRASDYNRFQEKMRTGNAQIYPWGWNADYPDAENFFFLLYGGNGKVKFGGENASNYASPEFDLAFEKMSNMDNTPERFEIIQQMQERLRHDAPWIFGYYPKDFSLYHSWYENLKPNLMANNTLKYARIDAKTRNRLRLKWNKPVFLPLFFGGALLLLGLIPAIAAYRRRTQEKLQ